MITSEKRWRSQTISRIHSVTPSFFFLLIEGAKRLTDRWEVIGVVSQRRPVVVPPW